MKRATSRSIVLSWSGTHEALLAHVAAALGVGWVPHGMQRNDGGIVTHRWLDPAREDLALDVTTDAALGVHSVSIPAERVDAAGFLAALARDLPARSLDELKREVRERGAVDPRAYRRLAVALDDRDDEALALLRAGLHATNAAVRTESAGAAAMLGWPELAPDVTAALARETDPRARTALTAAHREDLGDAVRALPIDAAALRSLAAHASADDPERELQLLYRVLDLDESAQDAAGQVDTLHALSRWKERAGEFDQAWAHWNDAAEIARESGDAPRLARTLDEIGRFLHATGNADGALQAWEDARRTKGAHGDVRGRAETTHRIAQLVAFERGELDAGLSLWEQAIVAQRQCGDSAGEAASLHDVGRVHAQQGRVADALRAWNDALALREKHADLRGCAETMQLMADLLAREGDRVGAEQLLHDAQDRYRRLGDAHGVAVVLNRLGIVAAGARDLAQAVLRLREAIDAFVGLGAWRDVIVALDHLAGVDERYERPAYAQAMYVAAHALVPFQLVTTMASRFCETVGPASRVASLAAAAAVHAVESTGAGHADQREWHGRAVGLLDATAQARGADTSTDNALLGWMAGEGLRARLSFLAPLQRALRAEVREWWFEPGLLDAAVDPTMLCADARAHLERLCGEERWESVLALAEAVLSLEREDYAASAARAMALTFLGRHDESIEAHRRAIARYDAASVAPSPPLPAHEDRELGRLHFNLACELSFQGHTLAALESLRRAVELSPASGHFARLARTEDYFAPLREDPAFRALVGA